jgi:hypothetical protein
MNSPRIGLGYDVFVASLPTPTLVATKEFLFHAGGDQTDFPKEKFIINCVEPLDKIVVPNMPEYENIFTDDLVVDIPFSSTPKSISDPNIISHDQCT